MATGDTVKTLAPSSSPPPLLDHSPSNLSSPLSDVEDKDGDADDMDIDMHAADFDHNGVTKDHAHGGKGESASGVDSDDESKLSEVDVNDSEAETERLFDTPRKINGTRDAINGVVVGKNQQFTDRRDRTFERSPSKLKQQIHANVEARNHDSDNDSLSGEEEDNDDTSLPSSEPERHPAKSRTSRSASPVGKIQGLRETDAAAIAQDSTQSSLESRKRKRSPLADHSDHEQPLRKRTGSGAAADRELSADDTTVLDDEGASANLQSGDHSGEEDNHDKAEIPPRGKEVAPERIDEEAAGPSRSKKSKRNNNKKRKSKSPDEGGGEGDERNFEGAGEDDDAGGAENAAHGAEDEQQEAEAEEENEAAHKEEELERKRAAWEELTAIERQFASFRERLYQERLDQLNQEEAMLNCDSPTHPEYLAMLKCIDERRDERIRLSGLELQFRMDVLRRRAVAERAQIMTQFYQSVRASRERVLEELGQDWYEIQYERRRQANNIPDYSIRFSTEKAQNVRNAVAYNKEVSILAGFAKHVGFPAAPAINGVSDDQLEHDFEAIHLVRQTTAEGASHHASAFQDLPVMSFGRSLGPAGDQFIEQPAWANPSHASHHPQRQQQVQQHEANASPPVTASSSANRKHLQPGAAFSSNAAATLNGDPTPYMQKAFPSAGHEVMKASKMGPEPPMKREAVAPAF